MQNTIMFKSEIMRVCGNHLKLENDNQIDALDDEVAKFVDFCINRLPSYISDEEYERMMDEKD